MSLITATSSIVQPPLTVRAAAGAPPPNNTAASIPPGVSAAAVGATPASADAVDAWMQQVSHHNQLANLLAHFDFKDVEKRFGTEKAIEGQANQATQGARLLQVSQAHLTRESWGLGVSVQPLSSDQTKTGGVAGPLSVNNFSFTSGGSAYTVTAGQDGAMVGTKDGHAWKTWQITPNLLPRSTTPAETALSTLKTLADQLQSRTDNENSLPVLHVTI